MPGPLDHPRLRAIEQHIDRGELAEAQRLLADLGDSRMLRDGTSYLATRLLYERGRLDKNGFIERLRELVRIAAPFSEAEAMLRSAEQGELERAAPQEPGSGVEHLFAEPRVTGPSLPSIPRAPGLPHFTPFPDLSPSYAPAAAPDGTTKAETEPPRPGSLPYAITDPDFLAHEAPSQAACGQQPRPRSIRSGWPPELDARGPASLIEIAALLDEGRFDEAMASIDRSDAPSADQQLLRARALQGSGNHELAVLALLPLCEAPLLEPELRASTARLLLELGELDKALEQSELAHQDEPDSLFVRLTLAWSKLRTARRTADRTLVEEAQRLLEGIQTKNLPLPALVLGLRACVQAHIGDPARAIGIAQRALAMDSRSIDALTAIAIASARLKRAHDAEQAWLRLLDANIVEARFVSRELKALGVRVTDSAPPRQNHSADAAAVWGAVEIALVNGERSAGARALEQLCHERLAQLRSTGFAESLPALTALAASVFTTAPVWHHFAPFDLSLWSIPRLAAVLDLIYGPEPRATVTDDAALVTLAGAYLGEALRQSHAGTWHGFAGTPAEATVSSEAGQWRPFQIIEARIKRGMAISVKSPTALAHPADDPWSQRVESPVSPPAPWSPRAWPDPAHVEQLGRALSHSVVSVYCRDFAQGPLDRSIASLGALDAYLSIVAPPRAPIEADPAWARRLAVLLGAYVGETVRETIGGHWHHEDCAAVDADGYVLVLNDASTITPIAQVMARVIGDTKTSLSDYAARLLKKLSG